MNLAVVKRYENCVLNGGKGTLLGVDGRLRTSPVFTINPHVLIQIPALSLHNKTVLREIVNEVARLHVQIWSLAIDITGKKPCLVVHAG